MTDKVKETNKENNPTENKEVEMDSKVDSKATETNSQKEATKEESPKVEEPQKTEQPEKSKEEDKQVEKDSGENGEDQESKSYSSKRMTKAELIAELDDMKDDMETISAKLVEKETAYTQLQAELETYKAKIKEMEQASESNNKLVSEIVEAKKNSLPKEIQELMPDGTLEQQLAWLNKAEQSGLGAPKKEKPNVEIGKPMNMGVPQNTDTSKMTPQQKLSSYFAQVFTK